MSHLSPRAPRFAYADDFDPRWTPRFPEVAAVANSVSLAMPFVEPFVIRAVRRVEPQIKIESTRTDLLRFVKEEAVHHAEHRRFNQLVVARYPTLRWVERLMRISVAGVGQCGSRLGTGFAAGFELAGLAVASWLAPRADLLLGSAEPTAKALFLWHLCEEVDHRSIAHDVHRASGGGRFSATVGLLLSLVLLGMCATSGAALVFLADRRFWKPVAWWRLITWGIGFLYVSGPLLVSSLWRHPSWFPVPTEVTFWRDEL